MILFYQYIFWDTLYRFIYLTDSLQGEIVESSSASSSCTGPAARASL